MITDIPPRYKQYLFIQYKDDVAIEAFPKTFNSIVSEYVKWVNTWGLALWDFSPARNLPEGVLEFVGTYLYGIPRPYVTEVSSVSGYDFQRYDEPADTYDEAPQVHKVDIDIYRAILKWQLYRGYAIGLPGFLARAVDFMGSSTDVRINFSTLAVDRNKPLVLFVPNNARGQSLSNYIANGTLSFPVDLFPRFQVKFV